MLLSSGTSNRAHLAVVRGDRGSSRQTGWTVPGEGWEYEHLCYLDNSLSLSHILKCLSFLPLLCTGCPGCPVANHRPGGFGSCPCGSSCLFQLLVPLLILSCQGCVALKSLLCVMGRPRLVLLACFGIRSSPKVCKISICQVLKKKKKSGLEI